MTSDDIDITDAADTLRFVRPDIPYDTRRDFDFEGSTDSDATSIYDLGGFDEAVTARHIGRSKLFAGRRRRQIRDTRANVLRLREAIADGWDIAPELAHEERHLSALVAADRR